MSILFLDSMSHYATADIAKKWTTVGPATGTTPATLVLEPTGGRRGAGCLQFTTASANSTYPLGFSPRSAPGASGVVGTAVKITGLANISVTNTSVSTGFLGVLEGSIIHIYFQLNANGTISVYRSATTPVLLGTSTEAVMEAEWSHLGFEWTIHDSTGVVTIYRGTRSNVILSLPNIDTRNGGTGAWTSYVFFGPGWATGASAVVARLCDHAAMDTAGSANTQYPGDRTVNAFPVVDDGFHADSTPSAGSDRFAMLDEATPDGDTTNTVLAAAGDADTYKIAAITGVIDGLQLSAAAKKVGDGAASIKSRWRQNSTDSDATVDQAVASTDYLYYAFPYDVNPETGVAFVASEFGAIGDGEIGIVKET